MESVSNEEEVGVDEADRLGAVLLELGARVKDELNPALSALMSNVVLQWSSDLALASKGTVHESIEDRGFKSRHFLLLQKFIITNACFNPRRHPRHTSLPCIAKQSPRDPSPP